MRILVAAALFSVMLAPACGARQWQVVFSTNAQTPRMGDRLSVEVLDENGNLACGDCAREFSEENDYGIKSIGVAPTDGAVRIRARLFRYVSRVKQTEQRTIDVVARLPELSGSDSIMTVEFPIPVECFGVPPDLAKGVTCQRDGVIGPEPTLGGGGRLEPAPTDVPCEKTPPAGMTCVGSGTFLMGDERVDALTFDYPARPESVQRIRSGAALMLDIDETTVGEVRALVRAGKIDPATGLTARGAPSTREEACTWIGPDDGKNDRLPINCVSRDLARAICVAKGRRLPFEHEWEFAAGNGTAETLYPWGNGLVEDEIYDVAAVSGREAAGICQYANVANGREDFGESVGCQRASIPFGPRADAPAGDVTTQGVKNMGGNVAEWVDGELALYDDECWSKPLAAPCRAPSTRIKGARAPFRGGSWGRPAHATFAVARFAETDAAPSPHVGIRCATTEAEMP